MPDIFDDADGEVIEVGGDAPPAQPQRATLDPQGPPPSLRAQWDQNTRCWVALHQGDRPLENWRPPTKEEWDALKVRGVLTRPSPMAPVGAAPATEPTLVDRLKQNALPFAAGAGLAVFALKVLPTLLPRSNPAPAQPVQSGGDEYADDGDNDGDSYSDEDIDEEAVG